jgi:serine/threonine protein kinase
LVVADDARRAALKEVLVPWFSVVEAKGAQPGMSYLREAAFDAVIASDETRQLALKSMFGMVKKLEPMPATFLLATERSTIDDLRSISAPNTQLFAADALPETIVREVLAAFGRSIAPPTKRTYDRRNLVDRTKSWDVHLAVASTGETVLLSEPGARLLEDAETCAEFVRVGALASKVGHPNLAPIFDLGDAERPFIAYGAPSGLTLAQLRKWLIGEERRVSTILGINIVGEVLAALEPVHDAKLTHGALDPSALWLSADGMVTVLHVGTGRMMGSLERSRGTQGTAFPYMAPEQVVEQHTDSRTDLFLAGILLYELLANEPVSREDAIRTQARSPPDRAIARLHPAGGGGLRAEAFQDRTRPKSAHAALAELAAAAQDRKQRGSRSSSGVFGRIFGGKKSNDSMPPQTAEGGPRVELSGLVRAALRG